MAKQPRKYSRPHSKKMVVVQTEASIKAMEQFVNRTMSSLYALDVILYYIADESVADKANQQVRDLFDSKIEQFDKDISKLRRQVEENAVDMPNYDEAHSSEYKIYSPLCSVFLKLINKFETNTQLIDALWLDGEIPSSVRKTKTTKLARHLANISRQVVNASNNAMLIAKDQGKVGEIDSTLKEMEQKNSSELLSEAGQAVDEANHENTVEAEAETEAA